MSIPIIPALVPPLLFLAQISAAGGNLLENPSFSNELTGWQKGNWPAEIQAAAVMEDGKTAGRITVSSEAAIGFPALYQERPARPGDVFEARVDALPRGVNKDMAFTARSNSTTRRENACVSTRPKRHRRKAFGRVLP